MPWAELENILKCANTLIVLVFSRVHFFLKTAGHYSLSQYWKPCLDSVNTLKCTGCVFTLAENSPHTKSTISSSLSNIF